MVVCPVGFDARRLVDTVRPSPGAVPLVVSNQRWHHDKDVGAVLRALLKLGREGLDFRVAVVGDDRGGEAEQLDPLLDQLGERLVQRGLLDRHAYEALLSRADIVVSVALNEFFGIAVAEGIAAGAWPVVPAALAYPEVIAVQYHDVALYGAGELTNRLRATIEAVFLSWWTYAPTTPSSTA